jgi:hypothetical protein
VIPSGGGWLHRGPLGLPQASVIGLRSLGGGLRSWLGVRCTRTPALYLTAPPSCGRFALYRETRGDAGGSAERPMERGTYCVERNRQRAGERSRAERKAPASQGDR